MKTIKDFQDFLAAVRSETGIDAMTADEDGLMSVRVNDEFNLNLQFIEASGKILCFVETATLPQDAPASVYRELLAAALFGSETAGGYFALESKTGAVVYNYLFDSDRAEADVEQFVETLEKILQLCGMWAMRIEDLLKESEPEHQIEQVTTGRIYP
jgi:hypothetical protein